MSFDYTTLITDRARSDSDTLKALLEKPLTDWTEAERTAFNSAMLKGSYDYTDLNRVDACMEDLVARLNRVGCLVPGYQRVKIERAVTPSSRLPDGYTEVQYIQSSGTQWIDTGVKPNQSTRAVADAVFPTQSAAAWLFGARHGNTDRTFGFLTLSGAYRSDYNTSTTEETISNPPTGRIVIDKDRNITKINDSIVRTAKAGVFQCAHTLFLFANNNNGTSAGYSTATLYSFRLYDDGTLVRDFLPCVDPTGTVGLYDLVGGKFYGNSGTGVFLAGPPKVTLPEGYAQVEYIQSSGAQYVDTRIRQNQNSRVIVDFQLISNPSSSYAWIFEGRDTGPKNRHSVYAAKSDGNWRCGYGSASKNTNIPYDLSARITADFNKNVLKIGNTSTTFAQEVFQSATNTVLFGRSTGGTIDCYAQAKLFGCRFFDGDTLLRDYIPCKNAGGAVGLYDLIGQKFYGNAGTGSFAAGPVVTWEAPEEPTDTLDPYTWYESDVPTVSLLSRYRDNAAAVRAVLRLPEGTPEVPATLRRMTQTEANSIEAVLLTVALILNHIPAAVRHCGVTVCGGKGVRA